MRQKKLITFGNFELLDSALKDAAESEGVSESVITERIFTDYFLNTQDSDFRYAFSDILYADADNGVSRCLAFLFSLKHKLSQLTTKSVTDLLHFAWSLELRHKTIINDVADTRVHAIIEKSKCLKDFLIERNGNAILIGNFWNFADIKKEVDIFNSCAEFATYIDIVITWWDRSIPSEFDGVPDVPFYSNKNVLDILYLIFSLSHYPVTPQYRYELGRLIKNLKFESKEKQ